MGINIEISRSKIINIIITFMNLILRDLLIFIIGLKPHSVVYIKFRFLFILFILANNININVIKINITFIILLIILFFFLIGN